jgi:hypothetical protein
MTFKKLTQEEFVIKANKKHNNKYNYSKVIYIGSQDVVIIICEKHGEFSQTPNAHLNGNGCSKCAGNNVPTPSEFIEKAYKIYGDKYDYKNVNYVNSITEIIITCKHHGDFKQIPDSYLRGHACKKCSGKYAPTTEEFIKMANEIHDSKYDYSKFEYINYNTKTIIICPAHGEFKQTPDSHRVGKGCKKCKLSKNEKLVGKFLVNNNIEFIWHYKILISSQKLFVDFYIESLNLIVEYNGLQHYQPVKFGSMTDEQVQVAFIKQKKRDKSLRKYCKQNDISLLEIDGRVYHGQNLIKYLNTLDLQNIKKAA